MSSFVQVQTTSGVVYEGVLRTFYPQFDVVLEMAHCVDPSRPGIITVETLVDKLIFRASDIITIQAKDVDLEYATKGKFHTTLLCPVLTCVFLFQIPFRLTLPSAGTMDKLLSENSNPGCRRATEMKLNLSPPLKR